MTGNLYRPREVKEKLPAIVYVCGHAAGARRQQDGYQEHGIWFAATATSHHDRHLQLGEIAGSPSRHLQPGALLVVVARLHAGRVECWNGIRAIDYLLARPDVDPAKIGVTGISGGGAATFWIAAADERVKVAVPVSGMSDLESYVNQQGHQRPLRLHVPYNTYQWEWTTIAAMIAPRPMLFANSDNDPIFPMDANHRIIERLRKFYAMLGHPERIAEQ